MYLYIQEARHAETKRVTCMWEEGTVQQEDGQNALRGEEPALRGEEAANACGHHIWEKGTVLMRFSVSVFPFRLP